MRIGLFWRALALAVVVGTLGLMVARLSWASQIPGWSAVSIVLCGLLVLVAVGPWWCVLLLWRMIRRAPDVIALRGQLERFTLTGAGATALALVALNYLLGSPLPRGGAFILLVAGVLPATSPCWLWLYSYYRRP